MMFDDDLLPAICLSIANLVMLPILTIALLQKDKEQSVHIRRAT